MCRLALIVQSRRKAEIERMPVGDDPRKVTGVEVPLILSLRAFEASAVAKSRRSRSIISAAADGAGLIPTRILLVTGMSGAGKTTALKTLEDMDWEVVDNLPLRLLDRLLATRDTRRRGGGPPARIGYRQPHTRV